MPLLLGVDLENRPSMPARMFPQLVHPSLPGELPDSSTPLLDMADEFYECFHLRRRPRCDTKPPSPGHQYQESSRPNYIDAINLRNQLAQTTCTNKAHGLMTAQLTPDNLR